MHISADGQRGESRPFILSAGMAQPWVALALLGTTALVVRAARVSCFLLDKVRFMDLATSTVLCCFLAFRSARVTSLPLN